LAAAGAVPRSQSFACRIAWQAVAMASTITLEAAIRVQGLGSNLPSLLSLVRFSLALCFIYAEVSVNLSFLGVQL